MKRLPLYSLLIIIVGCLIFDFNYRWKNDWWRSTIHSDGYGYYGYLPCIFIYHKFDYDRSIQAEKQARPEVSDFEASYTFPFADNGHRTDKCSVGEAVLLAPFFLLAYFLSYLMGFSTNGYSILFQYSVSIAALTYLIIGLIFVRKLLLLYNFSDKIIIPIQFILFFGTNLLYYSTIEPYMSHVYCFCSMAALFYYAKRTFIEINRKYLLLIGTLIGILIILRPTGVLSLAALPFLAGSKETFLKSCKQFFTPVHFVLCLIPLTLVVSIQLILWYMQSGHFIYWSYGGEGFYFAHPKFLGILFNFQTGWFIYTPIMFVAFVFGLGLELKRNIFSFISFLVFFIFLTYVLSSWYCWYYGGYSLRAYIDYYAVFSILLGSTLSVSKKWLRGILFALCIFLTYVNLVQTRQVANSIIDTHYMDADRYWKVFLKTDAKYVNMLSQNAPDSIKVYSNLVFRSDFENNSWGNDNSINDSYSLISRHSAYVGKNINYSPTLCVAASQLPNDTLHYLYASLWAYMNDTNNNAALIISAETKDGTAYFYNDMPLRHWIHKPGSWSQARKLVTLPKLKNADDIIKVYEFATTGATYIDNVNISFGTRKKLNPEK